MTWIGVGFSLLVLSCIFLLPQTASGQNGPKDEEKEIPKPIRISLRTRDGVQLSAFYLAGNLKKDTMPVIMLHDWKESSGAMAKLALRIQNEGHAVLVPDLRGHGKSTSVVTTKPNGLPETRELNLDLDNLTKLHITGMIQDVEACKQFLMQRHNEGELNIEKLTVIGAGLGGMLAMNWAAVDWNANSNPLIKNGQDVKSLVLLSPLQSFKGLTNQAALGHSIIAGGLNTLILVGTDGTVSKELSDAKRLYNRMERFHGAKPDDATALKDHRLFLLELKTASQGSAMLREKDLKPNPNEIIWSFLRSKIVDREILNFGGRVFPLEWKRRGTGLPSDP
jgi:pimeloyl-ACP methyl ester carboxylesterase